MTSHLRDDRIHDYVDDLLCVEERAEAEAHLRVCDVCRSEVAALRDLVAGLHAAPASIRPERDLLSQIHARMDERAAGAGVTDSASVRTQDPAVEEARIGERTLRSMRYPLAAAAMLLVLLSAAVTTMLVRTTADDAPAADARPNGNGSGAVLANRPAPLNAVEQRYREAATELETLLAARRDSLTPETIRLVEDNLRVIDAALGEARAALREDPANPALTDLVRSAYEKKIDLLRHATETRGET